MAHDYAVFAHHIQQVMAQGGLGIGDATIEFGRHRLPLLVLRMPLDDKAFAAILASLQADIEPG